MAFKPGAEKLTVSFLCVICFAFLNLTSCDEESAEPASPLSSADLSEAGNSDSAYGITFIRSFRRSDGGNEGHVVVETSDGSYVTFGVCDEKLFFVKTDSLGVVVWSRLYGSGHKEFGESMDQTSDGGFIVSGQTRGWKSRYGEPYLIRTNSVAEVLWRKLYGDSSSLSDFTSVIETSDGYIIAGGWNWNITLGLPFRNLLVKTNANGDTVWKKIFGGYYDEEISQLKEVSDGYVMVGHTNNTGAGSSDVQLTKTDKDGTILWQRRFGGSGYDYGYAMDVAHDGGFILTGFTESNSYGRSDIYLVRTDPNGILIWEQRIGESLGDFGYSVAACDDGGYIVTGISEAEAGWIYLVRTDANGTSQWTRRFGYPYDKPFCVRQVRDGGFALCGYRVRANYTACMYLVKTDALGRVRR